MSKLAYPVDGAVTAEWHPALKELAKLVESGAELDPRVLQPVFCESLNKWAGRAHTQPTGPMPWITAPNAGAITLQLLRLLGRAPRNTSQIESLCDPTAFGGVKVLLASILVQGGRLRELFDDLQEQRPVCGRVFEDGDLAYTCVDCRTDGTCVVCEHCFIHANHEGHRVRYHRTSAGGICDCGDHEAWKPSGFCQSHCGLQSSSANTTRPTSALPAIVEARAQAIIVAIVQHLTRFVLTEQASFKRLPEHRTDALKWVVVLHNDDKHTFEDVIHALLACRFGGKEDEARRLTKGVDENGAMIVFSSADYRVVEKVAEGLRSKHGLLVSIKHETWACENAVAVAAVNWLQTLAQESASMGALIAEALIVHGGDPALSPEEGKSAGDGSSVRNSVSESNDRREGVTSAAAAMGTSVHGLLSDCCFWRQVGGIKVFWCPPHTEATSLWYWYSNADDEWKWSPAEPGDTLEGKPVADFEQEISKFRGLNIVSCGNETILHCLRKSPVEAREYLLDVVARESGWESRESKRQKLAGQGARERVRNMTDGVPLETWVSNGELLSTPLTAALHDLYATLWAADSRFKTSFSQSYTNNLPSRCYRYVLGVGTEDNSLEKLFCVQVFTTPSIVEKLAKEDNLFTGILASIHLSFLNSFHTETNLLRLNDWPLKHDRHSISYEHLYYSLRIPAGMHWFLWESPSHMGMFVRLLSYFQGIDQYRRQTGHHVEFESEDWKAAFTHSLGLARRFFHTLVDGIVSADLATVIRDEGKDSDRTVPSVAERKFHTRSCLRLFQGLLLAADDGRQLPFCRIDEASLDEDHDLYRDVCDQQNENMVLLGRTIASQCMVVFSSWAVHSRSLPAVHICDAPTGTFPVFSFDVMKDPVSLHYPLQNFFSMLVHHHESSLEAVPRERRVRSSLNEIFPIPYSHVIKHSRVYTARQMAAVIPQDLFMTGSDGGATWLGRLALLEFPLRVAAFSAQVRCSLWRRNGATLAYQMVHFSEPPYCQCMSDLVLKSLQIGLLGVGPDHFVTCLIDRFGLEPWLYDEYAIRGLSSTNVRVEGVWKLGPQAAAQVMSECLTIVIQILTEFSPALESVHDGPIVPCLRRELVHALAAGPRKRSQLIKGISDSAGISLFQGGSPMEVLWDQLQGVASEVADYRDGEEGEPGTYALKKEILLNEYDPYFLHLNRETHNEIREGWVRGRAESYQKNLPRPPVHALMRVPKNLGGIRDLLLSPSLLEVIRPIIGRVNPAKELVTECLRLLGMAIMALEEGASGRTRFLRSITLRHPCGINDVLVVDSTIEEGSVIDSLLSMYRRNVGGHSAHLDKHERLVEREGLEWILFGLEKADENFSMSGTIKEAVNAIRTDGSIEVVGTCCPSDAEATVSAGAKAAQDAAMKAMSEKQNAFLAMMDDDSDESDSDEDSDDAGRSKSISSHDGLSQGEDACIFCHESTRSMLAGFIGYGYIPSGRGEKAFAIRCCSHSAHVDCLDTYIAMQVGRQSAESHSVDASRMEFLCPLCKRLSNLLVPSFPQADEKSGALSAEAVDLDREGFLSHCCPGGSGSPVFEELDGKARAEEIRYMSLVANVKSSSDGSKEELGIDFLMSLLLRTTAETATEMEISFPPLPSLVATLRACRASIGCLDTPTVTALYKEFIDYIGKGIVSGALLRKLGLIDGDLFLHHANNVERTLLLAYVFFSDVIPVFKYLLKVIHVAAIAQGVMYFYDPDDDPTGSEERRLWNKMRPFLGEMCSSGFRKGQKNAFKSCRNRSARMARLLLCSLENISQHCAGDSGSCLSLEAIETELDLPSIQSLNECKEGKGWASWLEQWCYSWTVKYSKKEMLSLISDTLVPTPPKLLVLEARFDRLLASYTSRIQSLPPRDEIQPCLCLVCGTVLAGGLKNGNNVGACHDHVNQRHACKRDVDNHRTCGVPGVGAFLCLSSTNVILIRRKYAAYFPSIYVDEYGEADPYLRRGAPLHLNVTRFKKLELMWAEGKIANEVVQIRCRGTSVIRENWF